MNGFYDSEFYPTLQKPACKVAGGTRYFLVLATSPARKDFSSSCCCLQNRGLLRTVRANAARPTFARALAEFAPSKHACDLAPRFPRHAVQRRFIGPPPPEAARRRRRSNGRGKRGAVRGEDHGGVGAHVVEGRPPRR